MPDTPIEKTPAQSDQIPSQAEEQSRAELRKRQARFRKEHAKNSVRLELRIPKDTETLLAALAKRAGRKHKNSYAAELLTKLIEERHKKSLKTSKKKPSDGSQSAFDF